MSKVLDRIEQIKVMRRAGYSYQQIADTHNVSVSTAHKYGRGEAITDQNKMRFQTGPCGRTYKKLACVRHAGHRGVHLSDKNGKLIYWS